MLTVYFWTKPTPRSAIVRWETWRDSVFYTKRAGDRQCIVIVYTFNTICCSRIVGMNGSTITLNHDYQWLPTLKPIWLTNRKYHSVFFFLHLAMPGVLNASLDVSFVAAPSVFWQDLRCICMIQTLPICGTSSRIQCRQMDVVKYYGFYA